MRSLVIEHKNMQIYYFPQSLNITQHMYNLIFQKDTQDHIIISAKMTLSSHIHLT